MGYAIIFGIGFSIFVSALIEDRPFIAMLGFIAFIGAGLAWGTSL